MRPKAASDHFTGSQFIQTWSDFAFLILASRSGLNHLARAQKETSGRFRRTATLRPGAQTCVGRVHCFPDLTDARQAGNPTIERRGLINCLFVRLEEVLNKKREKRRERLRWLRWLIRPLQLTQHYDFTSYTTLVWQSIIYLCVWIPPVYCLALEIFWQVGRDKQFPAVFPSNSRFHSQLLLHPHATGAWMWKFKRRDAFKLLRHLLLKL